jgi:hypothetical protein
MRCFLWTQPFLPSAESEFGLFNALSTGGNLIEIEGPPCFKADRQEGSKGWPMIAANDESVNKSRHK